MPWSPSDQVEGRVEEHPDDVDQMPVEAHALHALLGRGQGDERITLKRPHGVTREKDSLYVCDTYNNRIFRLELAE